MHSKRYEGGNTSDLFHKQQERADSQISDTFQKLNSNEVTNLNTLWKAKDLEWLNLSEDPMREGPKAWKPATR